MTELPTLGVCIFAHNEQDNIKQCMQSVINATKHPERLRVKVIVNGTTDQTSNIVRQFSSHYPQIELVEIALGDKSNAWNEYVYGDIDLNSKHFFLDGDNWLPAYSLDYIEEHWQEEIYWGVACLPIGVSESLRAFLNSLQLISGNGYGVSSRFIQKVRANEFKIPIGFIGDDSVVSYLLQDWSDNKKKGLVQVISNTGPIIPRLNISWSNIKMLHNRYKRYAIRHIQQEIFYYLAKQKRLNNIPAHACDLKKFLRNVTFRNLLQVSAIQLIYIPYAYLSIILTKKASKEVSIND